MHALFGPFATHFGVFLINICEFVGIFKNNFLKTLLTKIISLVFPYSRFMCSIDQRSKGSSHLPSNNS